MRDAEDAKCMRAMWMIFGGLFGLFVGLILLARMITA